MEQHSRDSLSRLKGTVATEDYMATERVGICWFKRLEHLWLHGSEHKRGLQEGGRLVVFHCVSCVGRLLSNSFCISSWTTSYFSWILKWLNTINSFKLKTMASTSYTHFHLLRFDARFHVKGAQAWEFFARVFCTKWTHLGMWLRDWGKKSNFLWVDPWFW